MAERRATLGADLHLELSGSRVRGDLERALREAVQSGRLPAGGRLPSTRGLAAELGVARNTVAEAYAQLIAEGWLVGRQGSGTRVNPDTAAHDGPRPTLDPPRPVGRYDLRPGAPDVALFPRTAWLTALRRALLQQTPEALRPADPQGSAALRGALARYLARARGVRVSPDQLVICAGPAQALALLGRALAGLGARTIAVESFGAGLHREVVAAAGLRPVPMPVDGAGIVPSGLSEVDAALLTPAHQFPLGMALSPARRTAVVRSAPLVVEDDYDGEFRYDRHAVGALQALDPHRVAYLGSTAQTLAPGLRLGWLVTPPRLVEPVVAARRLLDGHGSELDQLALADLIGSGHYERHIRRCRLIYRRRRDRVVAALRAVPGLRIAGVAAGLHLVAELPPGHREAEILAAAEERGVTLGGLADYRAEGQPDRPPALVVGFGRPREADLEAALRELVAVLARPSPG